VTGSGVGDERPDQDNEDNEDDDDEEEDEMVVLQREAEMSVDELRAMYGAREGEEDAGTAAKSKLEGEQGASHASAVEDKDSDVPPRKRPRRAAAMAAAVSLARKSKPMAAAKTSVADAGALHGSAILEDLPLVLSDPSDRHATPVPFLLRRGHLLRDYQREGLDWLAGLHDGGLNGILADEMGLGKTLQTVSLLAHLASHRGIWGPHLIVVPTSTLLNWEAELRRWCPALKVVTYYGTGKERKAKRVGWGSPDAFHVLVTSYQLAVQDVSVLRRRRWYYMVLDEAHFIKNYQSARWQALMGYRSHRRLLLTGTPL